MRQSFHDLRAGGCRPRGCTIMTTPMKPVPELVARWMARVRWFRWLDAFVAWAGLWGISAAVLGRAWAREAAVLALILVGLGLIMRPLRTRWRPLSGWVGLAMSRGLHPGDRTPVAQLIWTVYRTLSDRIVERGICAGCGKTGLILEYAGK